MHLAQAPSAAVDNDERQRYVEKSISPDPKKRREDHDVDLNDRQSHVAINSETSP
jgi:hypothetical protein